MRDIDFYSLCEHHLLPFLGRVHMAYLLKGKVVEGLHMCSAMRSVKKANARMTTSAMLGTFRGNQASRSEFFEHIGHSRLTF